MTAIITSEKTSMPPDRRAGAYRPRRAVVLNLIAVALGLALWPLLSSIGVQGRRARSRWRRRAVS